MTRMCAFRDLFEDYLKELISLGGDATRVVALVHAYESDDSASRQTEFREWLENEFFICERCGHEFSGRRLEIKEDDLVRCPPCAAWRRGYEEARGRR